MTWAPTGRAPAPRDVAEYGSAPPLRGSWLVLARVAWIIVVLAILGLDAYAIPAELRILHVACLGDQCQNHQLTPVELQQVHTSNFSLDAYAIYWVVLDWISSLIYAGIAAVIIWRRSENRMALFCAFTLVVFGAAQVYGSMQALPVSNPVWRLPINLIGLVGTTAFYVFFSIFPSGRFVPRWMRWAAVLWPLSQLVGLLQLPLPYEQPGSITVLAVFYIILIAAQVYRYRRVSSPLQRQQTRWVVFGFAAGFGGFLILLGFGQLPNQTDTFIGTLIATSLLSILLWIIPICIGVAMLRSGLWDVDILINRTLVYGSLTAILATVYFAVVYGAQFIFNALVPTPSVRQSPVLIVVSTLLVAALFTPLRRRIQASVDRRFYRRKYDAAKTLAAFGATLRSEVDLSDLKAHLVNVVHETMQPTQVSLWLREPAAKVLPSGQTSGQEARS